jgi:hypothetical protein
MFRFARDRAAGASAGARKTGRTVTPATIVGWAALLATVPVLPGVHPPPYTGNGSGIHMQGGTRPVGYYVYGPWIDACNQSVHDRYGHVIGVYIDDSVNQTWPGNTTEVNCVTTDKAAGWKLIIAAAPQSSPNWNFAPYGATYTAVEWYPYCGSTVTLGPPPTRAGYIAQWNFVFDKSDIGLGTGPCPATPRASINKLLKQMGKHRPKMVFYY